MTNADESALWDGERGQHWVLEADRYGEMLKPFGDRVLSAIAPSRGERILDVGCGNGDLALALADRVGPSGSVVGADLSGPMLANATRRAANAALENVHFQQADAQTHDFEPGSFDALVSRFGVMFFDDPPAAFANLACALRPGGRIAFACWQDLFENEYIMVPVAAALEHVPVPNVDELSGPGPYSLADPTLIRTLLEGSGFVDVEIEPVQEPIRMGQSADDVVDFFHDHEFAEILFSGVDEDAAARAWEAVGQALHGRARAEGIYLNGAAWLVTGRRGTGSARAG